MLEVLGSLFKTPADQIYTTVIILALPFIIAAINREYWSSFVKAAFTVGACAIAAAGWLIFHEFATNKWVVYAAVILGGTQLIYFAMKPAVKQVEAKTG